MKMKDEDYTNKKIEVVLRNGYKYSGKVLEQNNEYIKIFDKFSKKVYIKKDMLSQIVVIE
jgi:hypothetical protein